MVLLVPEEINNQKSFSSENVTLFYFSQRGDSKQLSSYFQKDCLIFVQEGKKIISTSSQSYEICESEAFFVPMGSYGFSNIASNGMYRSLLFFFEKHFLLQFAKEYCISQTQSEHLGFCHFGANQNLKHLMQSLLLNQERFNDASFLELKAKELLFTLMHSNKKGFLKILSQIFNRKSSLSEQLNSQPFLQVKDMAKEVRLDGAMFSRKFKEETGITPKEWLDKKRFSKAKMMLEYENKNIAEIAYELDFSSPSWFIKRFKDYYGMTPKQFQKQSKN